ncbi:threonine aldolase family protein [Methylibium sp.]|uniref:threonine aldolase family protein n=1 Tax=Methylibium sp. TaxID=2067992 RepID=UPI003D0CF5A8
MKHQFASDNWAGLAPEALAALLEANGRGHAAAYGDDAWTQRACDAVRRVFDADCEVYFVFNGTAANALSLAALCRPYEAVVCTPLAHIAADECNAVGFMGQGVSLLPGDDGSDAARRAKLTPAALDAAARKRRDLHAPRARAVSLTQATELGTVYAVDELHALTAAARELKLKVHMDGARFANAVASLGCAPADASWRAGVDVLSFGATKNGAPVGEAVVFFDRALADGFEWRAKQAGQLASKMRVLTAPWVGLLEGGAWLAHAGHANAMARRLAAALEALPGARLLHAPQANGVFAELPRPAIEALRARGWRFHEMLPNGGCRLMCAWDTQPETVDAFAADLAAACTTP